MIAPRLGLVAGRTVGADALAELRIGAHEPAILRAHRKRFSLPNAIHQLAHARAPFATAFARHTFI
jgi:hypothetical protein